MSDTGLIALASFLRDAGYSFVTPTPATHRRIISRFTKQPAQELQDAFGWSRPFSRTLLPAALFEDLKKEAIILPHGDDWVSVVRASSLQGEMFLHSAFPTVSADAVFFGPDTYRFARAIRSYLTERPRPVRRALDIGCGTGAGAVVIAKNALCEMVLMTDINERALRMARVNAAVAGVKASVLNSDLFASVSGNFDLIVANPPYLNDPLHRAYRHGGGPFGTALSIRIAEAARDRLLEGGTLLLYTGSPIIDGKDLFLQAIEQLFQGGDLLWSYEEVDPDVFGEELETEPYGAVDRIAAVVLTAQKSGAPEC